MLVDYYRKFVLIFENILRNLTLLIKKDDPFKFTKMCHDTFNLLKRTLPKFQSSTITIKENHMSVYRCK